MALAPRSGFRKFCVAGISIVTLLSSGCGGSNALLPGNDPPHIDQILVNGVPGVFIDKDATAVTQVATNSTLSLVCNAGDRNRDPLTYQWSTTGDANSLTSTGGTDVASLHISSDGEIVVNCTVSDGRNGIVSRAVKIKATTTTNHAPTLDLNATPTTVAPNGSVVLTATASDQDADKLTYTFSVIPTGDGSPLGVITPDATDKTKATFVAPASAETALVLCVVSDGKGGSAAKTARITVVAP